MYQIKFGASEQNIIRNCERMKQPLPKEIANAPSLYPGSYLYYLAFHELGTCRQLGMAIGPIPYTSILQYCQQNDFDEETTDDVIYLVRVMDTAFLDHVEKTNKPKKHARRVAR